MQKAYDIYARKICKYAWKIYNINNIYCDYFDMPRERYIQCKKKFLNIKDKHICPVQKQEHQKYIFKIL